MGGIPPSTPSTLQNRAEVHLEGEDLYDLRASLEGDLEGYAILIASMREHIALAEKKADQGTVELFHDHLRDLEKDAHVLDQYLADDTLVLHDATK